ncbi:pyruvate dehydrogenase (acetyl-transferring) E1 component subunit alpha [Streptomyces sp. ID05-04B]|uniref:pyruvate dehydrogenase (acetyl-transferring) E1 component subunit alpha n=1 Tax=unclassified Streptomyces TaxID=2593676 RepID=UPI000D19D150|nr:MULTISPECIES: pyruvate dehydrogenase (acetyl-transferring) E1 component subunit alpha [unclassified Streptomyces]AVV44146.1 pyruvate dehydrogenase (acetyl-transferring) E1 component subunit alpha [Streptomyces sp. P3]MDX5565737.1 pyruvate dehydrogenase (acetyl-transferring) E1 component subunit alpha [Streptomyces sp. ID05-04B]
MTGTTPAHDPAADTAGTARPAPAAPFTADEAEALRGYYRRMALIRSFELRAAEMYTRAKIGGYCHLNLGEEATCVGLMAALRSADHLFTTYREHGYALARGADPRRVMAELFGRTTGLCGGRGGSMHLFDTRSRLLGGYGIVGGQLPPATGAALAISYRGEPGPDGEAVMCLLGDGATNIGAFHESLNLAAVWHLPIVYVIVNNQLGMGTPVAAAAGEPELYRRGCAYRISGTRVDGGDVLAVRDAARTALEQARSEHRPRLLEAVGYRLRGHSVVDPARYRTTEETRQLREKDPVPAFRTRLIEGGLLTPTDAARIDEAADAQVTAAVDFADASPSPSVDTLFDHQYATAVANTFRGLPGDPLPGAPDDARGQREG